VPSSLKTHSGKSDMPVIVLIHGLGMNNYFWVNPEQCYVLGGLAPLTIFLNSETEKFDNTISFGSSALHIESLWDCLGKAGFSTVSWTQSQPLGPIQVAVNELQTVVENVRHEWPGRKIYLVGHSRGGLIARQFLSAKSARDIAGLVTICSPHSGTSMAKFQRYLKPAGSFLGKILPNNARRALPKALNRLAVFLQSPAIAELEPGSEFMAGLNKSLPEQMNKLSIGGTNPVLFHMYLRLPGGNHKVIKFPDLFAGAVPSGHLPKELMPGQGDGLVTAESANLGGSNHFDFSDNHVKAAFDKEIQALILDFLQS
jgi:pimeloyl-ACP methyl ester carboxylesterase